MISREIFDGFVDELEALGDCDAGTIAAFRERTNVLLFDEEGLVDDKVADLVFEGHSDVLDSFLENWIEYVPVGNIEAKAS